MSFFTNPSQQMTLDDSTYHLTKREQKALEKSWAKPFAEEVFHMIDEELFRVLYYEKTGIDLIHNCIVSLASGIAHVMKITGRTRRMDSMMIDSNIKKLSRLELIYTCIANLVKRLSKEGNAELPEELKHYVTPNDFNQVFYYAKSSTYSEKCLTLLKDADALSELCKDTCADWE